MARRLASNRGDSASFAGSHDRETILITMERGYQASDYVKAFAHSDEMVGFLDIIYGLAAIFFEHYNMLSLAWDLLVVPLGNSILNR
jgi:hypothetical protein